MKRFRRNYYFGIIKIALYVVLAGFAYLALLLSSHLYLFSNEKDAKSGDVILEETRAENNVIRKSDRSIGNTKLPDLYWNLKDSAGKVYSKGIDSAGPFTPSSLWPARPPTPFNGEISKVGFDDRVVAQLVWSLGLMRRDFTSASQSVKRILLIDSFDWWNSNPTTLSQSCPGIEEKCHFVEHSYASGKADVDAVVAARDSFHHAEISVAENVTRIYFTMESPFHSRISLERDNDLLATFWRGSHLVTPYGKWVYYNESIRHKSQGRNYAAGKTKLGAIFISNCRTPNNRIDYVKKLQKLIGVDIYGMCGSGLHCLRSDKSACFDILKRHYKFYLSFENSNCRDYITEKLYENAYENDIVPVVMGAHPDDYRAVLPSHSYIHVEDFENPEALADYLKYLDSHDDEYNAYFEWKGTGEFIQIQFLCRVCGMLHLGAVGPNGPDGREGTFRWEESNMNLCLPRNRVNWIQKEGEE